MGRSMVSLFDDQAAGLRKLFAGARGPATIAFAGSGGFYGARNAMVAGLARGLAAAGKEVLVIDEHVGADSVAAAFGLRSHYDLMQALNRDVPANKVLLRAETSIRLLPAARAARQHDRLDAAERRALAEWLRRLQKDVDFVLVDAAERAGTEFSPLVPRPERIVVAVSPDGPSITEAYAQMKRLAHRHDCRRFSIAVLRAASLDEGQTVFANLSDVARRHLGIELDLVGSLAAQGDPGGIDHCLAESILNTSRDVAGNGRHVPRQRLRGAPQECFLEQGKPGSRGAPQEYFLEQGKPGSRGAPQEYFLEQGKPGSRGASAA